MNRKTPITRMCVVSREFLPKEEMYRVVRVNNMVYFDKEQKLKGRGVYIKKDLATIKEAFKRNSLSRGLKMKVDESIYLELIQALSKERR